MPFTTLLSVALLGEAVRWRRWTGIVLSFVGVGIMGFDPQIGDRWESLALVVASRSSARSAYRGEEAARLHAAGAAGVDSRGSACPCCCSCRCASSSRTSRSSQRRRPWKAWAALVFAAIGASLIAHTGYFHLVQRYPVTSVAPLTTLSPVFAVIFGVMLLGDELTPRILLGGACTLIGRAHHHAAREAHRRYRQLMGRRQMSRASMISACHIAVDTST